jgi:type I restriction enzyme S subunit
MNIEPFRINKDDLKYISPEFHAKIKKSRLRAGDVVIVRTGDPGTAAVVPEWMHDGNCSDLVIARPGPGVDAAFLCYYVNAVTHHIVNEHVVGAVQQHFNVGSAKSLKLPLPPLPEQRAIARVLGGLDDKIELNRRMNRTLEDLARGLFREWLDRMGVHAETVVAQTLIDAGTLEIGDGYRAKRVELRSTGLPFARAGNIDGGFQFKDCEYMGTDGVAAAGEKVSRPLDSVFTSKGTVGRLALVSEATPKFVYAPQLCFWRVKNPTRLSPYVLHQWMHDEEFGEQVDMTKGQTDMADYVSLTDQRRMRITLPPPELQADVGRHLERLYGMMAEHTAQSHALAATRDALLPVLLSGEVRLRSSGDERGSVGMLAPAAKGDV